MSDVPKRDQVESLFEAAGSNAKKITGRAAEAFMELGAPTATPTLAHAMKALAGALQLQTEALVDALHGVTLQIQDMDDQQWDSASKLREVIDGVGIIINGFTPPDADDNRAR